MGNRKSVSEFHIFSAFNFDALRLTHFIYLLKRQKVTTHGPDEKLYAVLNGAITLQISMFSLSKMFCICTNRHFRSNKKVLFAPNRSLFFLF